MDFGHYVANSPPPQLITIDPILIHPIWSLRLFVILLSVVASWGWWWSAVPLCQQLAAWILLCPMVLYVAGTQWRMYTYSHHSYCQSRLCHHLTWIPAVKMNKLLPRMSDSENGSCLPRGLRLEWAIRAMWTQEWRYAAVHVMEIRKVWYERQPFLV